jgi:hypothetical protein
MTMTFEHHSAQAFVDPCTIDTTACDWPVPAAPLQQDADYLLPPPNPAQRLSTALDPRDERRLDLHAALTAAGIPPRPEDRDAIDHLSALPDSVNTTLMRWLRHTT